MTSRLSERLDETARRPLILVVEDDRLLRHATVELLNEEGFAAIGVDDAPKALSTLQTSPDIALLITDVNMPGMDGVELARVAQARLPQLQLVITSGREQVDADHLPSMINFLQKPFSAKGLLEMVKRVLGSHPER